MFQNGRKKVPTTYQERCGMYDLMTAWLTFQKHVVTTLCNHTTSHQRCLNVGWVACAFLLIDAQYSFHKVYFAILLIYGLYY